MLVLKYTAYSAPAGDWGIVENPDLIGLEVVDSRERLKVGPGDLDAKLEQLIAARTSDHFFVRGESRLFEITVLEAQHLTLTIDEAFQQLAGLKQAGNDCLTQGDLAGAFSKYSEGVGMLDSQFVRRTPRDVKDLIIPLFTNKALCCLKLQRWAEAVAACDAALELDPNCVKALYRRALAGIENRNFPDAKRDLLSALFVEPNNSQVKQTLAQLKIEQQGIRFRKRVEETQAREGAGSFCEMTIRVDGVLVSEVLKFKLFDSLVPRTVENFTRIAQSQKYDHCRFFKIAKNQFAQSGDYDFNDGSGGDCALDQCDRQIRNRKFFNDENLDSAHDRKGLLGMANYGPNTNGSQFYLTLAADLHVLNGKHVVFGELISGSEVLDCINEAGAGPDCGSTPSKLIELDSVRILKP